MAHEPTAVRHVSLVNGLRLAGSAVFGWFPAVPADLWVRIPLGGRIGPQARTIHHKALPGSTR